MHPTEESDTGAAAMEMPRYTSHKKVWALEIATINRMQPGKIVLSFRDKGYAPMMLDEDHPLFARYAPLQGDYYVVYEDGYKSLSPRKAFVEGYTRDV